MAQMSLSSYFNSRKRPAVDEIKLNSKVLVLDRNQISNNDVKLSSESNMIDITANKKVLYTNGDLHNISESIENSKTLNEMNESTLLSRSKVITKLSFDNNLSTKSIANIKKKVNTRTKVIKKKVEKNLLNKQPDIKEVFRKIESKNYLNEDKIVNDGAVESYPTTPKKKSTMDKIASGENESLSLSEIKAKLSRSNRLAELKATMNRINKCASKLDELEKKTSQITSPGSKLKSFKTIDLEVPISPKKYCSEKPYLSPSKVSLTSPKKNIFGLLSPKKGVETTSPSKYPAYQRYANLALPGKPSLTLPYKYRSLAETFRCIDTVCAMFFNRKEVITFKKLKPAVQKMLHKDLTEKHLSQIKYIYSDSYRFSQEKMRNYGSTSKQDKYEFVIVPVLPIKNETETQSQEILMSPTILLERRRKLFDLFIEKVKGYHEEFLLTLDPPIVIPKDKITRWHPEFDIEQVPDIETVPLPDPPNAETLSTAKDVLLAAKNLFNCNTRMERALQKLAEIQQQQTVEGTQITNRSNDIDDKKIKNDSHDIPSIPKPTFNIKGIPKSLLEKVRARQAAKALESMTRTPQHDKESLQYSRLPDLSKLTRNVFVTEKVGVLPIDSVVNKLCNSCKTTLSKAELEEDLKLLSQVLPGWLTFYEIRKKGVYLKLSRDADMSKVLDKLQKLAEQKSYK